MNYTGNEDLRAAIAALSNDMCDMHLHLRELVSVYFWNSDVLAERLAGHILRDAHVRRKPTDARAHRTPRAR
jgi:hypothetical protein